MRKQEFIEVVDENNRSSGTKKERLLAHFDGNWHRTTQIWVLDREGRILINQRSKNQHQDTGKWASYFGGHLIFGENYFQGALREIEEELGLKINVQRLKKICIKKNRGPNEFVQIFSLILNRNEKFCFSKLEFQKVKFVSLQELVKQVKRKPTIFSGGVDYIKEQIKRLSMVKKGYLQ